MKLFFLVIGLFLLIQSANAQKFEIGKQAPDILLSKLTNTKLLTTRISDFKGKLLILDCWSRYCHSCIAYFPQMQKLQNTFDGKIQVLLTNVLETDTLPIVKNIIKGVSERSGVDISLPVALYDSTLVNAIRPFNGVPHEVWIGPNGTVLAITAANEVNENNIKSILIGITPKMTPKIATPLQLGLNGNYINRDIPYLFIDNKDVINNTVVINKSPITYQSGFTKIRLNGGLSDWKVDVNGALHGLVDFGRPLIDYYRQFYFDKRYDSTLPDIFEINDIELKQDMEAALFRDIDFYEHTYCYDLYSKKVLSVEVINNIVKQDLDRAFGRIYLKKEIRNIPCLIISSNPQISSIYSKGGIAGNTILYYPSWRKIYFHNGTIADLVSYSVGPIFKAQVVLDETGIKNNIDVDFPDYFDFNNKDAVVVFLKSKGIEVKIENRKRLVNVITDKNPEVTSAKLPVKSKKASK